MNLILFEGVEENKELIDFVKKSKGKYKFGIITTNYIEVQKEIEKRYGDLFDFYLASSYVGSDKKGEKIFNVALKKVNCNAEECIFVDNSENNLVVPKKMGFVVYEYEFKRDYVEDLLGKISIPF